MAKNRVLFSLAFLIFFASVTYAQDYPVGISFVRPNQEVIVTDLHLEAASSASSAPLVASAIETVLRSPRVCCGKDSALGETPLTDERVSLQDLGNKLSGRHILSDGRPVTITADYFAASTINSSQIVLPLLRQQPMLMQWNSHLYVLYGVTYDEDVYTDGTRDYVIHKLLLLDPGASGSTHHAVFDRLKDDWSKVQGLLLLTATPQ